MDHGLEWIIPNPGNIWKFDFYTFLISWKYWKLDFFNFPTGILEIVFCWLPGILEILEIGFFWLPGILEIRAAGGRRRAGGSRGCVVLPWIIFGTCFLETPDILEILEILFFPCIFHDFSKKRRAPKFHAGCTDEWAEISHMRPIQGQQLKLCFTLFSHYVRIILIF